MRNFVILIPGNPSVPGVYEPFLKRLLADLRLEGETEGVVLPHLGQCNRSSKRYNRITFHNVIDDHKESIHKLIKNTDRVYLIGHSLGGAVLISLYEEFQDLAEKFVFLCPFVGSHKGCETYLKMFKNPITRTGMITFSRGILLNKKVSQKFFNKWIGDNQVNETIIREIKKPHYISHFFKLVSQYHDSFDDLETRTKLGKICPEKSLFFFAGKDYWVPRNTVDLLPKRAKFFLEEELVHDFCLNQNQFSKLSKKIASHLLV